MKKNYGLDLEREKAEQDGSEWQFGGSSQQCLYLVPLAERKNYLPQGELQRGLEDYQDCVTRDYTNILETKFTYAYRNNLLLPNNKKWLSDNGYVSYVGGLAFVQFSDRFTAMKSGTTRTGNSMKAPAQSIHENGLIPKSMLPVVGQMTWDQYNNKADITLAMEALGKQFILRFVLNYDQVDVSAIDTVLTLDLVGVAGYAWPAVKNGEYPKSNNPVNHSFMAFDLPKTYIFDNYRETVSDPREWVKKLASDYAFYEYGYRLFISNENDIAAISQEISLLAQALQKLSALINNLFPSKQITNNIPMTQPTQTPEPTTVPTPPVQTASARAQLIATATAMIGKDASPKDQVPDEVACAESFCDVVRASIAPDFPSKYFTADLLTELRNNKHFKATLDLDAGNTIICATGEGNKSIHGHVGIILDGGKIASNNSDNGLWETKYTISTWVDRWRGQGGMPIYVFAPVDVALGAADVSTDLPVTTTSMFQNYSREQILRIVGMAFSLILFFGVDLTKYGLTADSVSQVIVTLILIANLLINGIGYLVRWSKGDVKLSGRRI